MKDTICIADCRVSDPQQLKGGSLEDQEMAIRKFAEKNGWAVDRVFRKPHSATTSEREDFEEVLTYISKRKKDGVQINKYVCKAIDRFTRMGAVEYLKLKGKLEELGTELVDTTGIIQPKKNSLEHYEGSFQYEWSIYSPSEGGELLAAQESKDEVRKILTRLIGAEIRLVQEGYAIRRPPDGLLNKKVDVGNKKRVVREPDPERQHYFRRMFELRAEGADDQTIVEQINAMGFRTRTFRRWDRSDKENPVEIGLKGGELLTIKQLQRYIQQTEYAGVIYEKWTKHQPVKAVWDGIVSVDTFNRANRGKIYIKVEGNNMEILHNYSPWGKLKRMKDNPAYPWKCVRCPHCELEMLGSASKGKSGKTFEAYHCGGVRTGRRAHKYIRIPKKEFEENISAYLDSLKFRKGFLAGLELHLMSKYRQKESEILNDSVVISRTVSDLKAELMNKLNAFGLAQSQITRQMLEEQISNLDRQIKEAEKTRGRIEITEKSIRAFRQYATQVMEHPAELLVNAENSHARSMLLELFFESAPTYSDILNGTPKLTPLFRLSEEFKRNKSQLVDSRGVEPLTSAMRMQRSTN